MYSTNLYGPVPLICVSNLLFSIAPFFRIAEERRMANAPSSGGNGALVVNLMVFLSITSTLSTWSKLPRQMAGPFGSSTISKVYLTSSALKSLPSWNFTPWRSLKIYVLSSGVVHDSASAGTIFRLESNAVRLS